MIFGNKNTAAKEGPDYFDKFVLDFVQRDAQVEVMQKAAWRLVRSAEDRFPLMSGAEKRTWCISRMQVMFTETEASLEDYIRSAYFNMTIETGEFQQKRSQTA